jgi:hypothetical protein
VRRRKLLGALAAGLLVLIAAGIFVLWPRPIVPGLTQENFDRVEIGMTLPEVKALLGEPDGLVYGDVFEERSADGTPIPVHPDVGIWDWNYEGDVSVSFNNNGRVSSKYSKIFQMKAPDPFGNPLAWLKHRWREWSSAE